MARGILSGVIWGVVVSGVGAGVLSVATGPVGEDLRARFGGQDPAVLADPAPADPSADPMPTVPEAAVPAPTVSKPQTPDAQTPVPQAPERAAPVSEPAVDPSKPGRRPQPETGIEMPAQPQGVLDAPAAPFAVGADTDLPKQPQVGALPDAPAKAEPSSDGAQVDVDVVAPVLPKGQSAAPGAPAPEAKLDFSTEPAQPPVPAISSEPSALVGQEPENPEPSPAPAPEPTPETEPSPAADDVADEGGAELAATPLAPAAPEPVIPTPVAPTPVVPEPSPPADASEDKPAGRPAIGKPAGSLLDRPSSVPTRRLSQSDDPASAAAPDSAASARPLEAFAAKLDPMPAADLPRIAIILIDDKVDTWGPEALKSLPIPVSIAIPPSHPTAAQTARDYRALGFEVLAMVSVPEGAQPSDVEVTLSATLQAVPEAVAILEDPSGGVQASRAVSNQTAAYLAESGHGLVMLPKGLNTAQQLAAKAGVPSASLFRDMDKDNQDAATVRRTLDQATFRAKQDGAAVMLGRLHANTLTGLIQWGLQDKNASIAIVPVSTVLKEADAQ